MNSKPKAFLIVASILGALMAPSDYAYSKTYLSVNQAQKVLFEDSTMVKMDVFLTKEQMKSIKKSSKTRVRNSKMNIWKTKYGDWFIVDNVIGKHENIDIAVALTKDGKVKGIEVLTYRETYGSQVMNKKWLAQFFGKDSSEILKLDNQIKNISGATLSCAHITSGVNRLTHTWDQVLKFL
ncbi:MAG: Na+-translocating ferredoxin:NAD+ oxidoreductase RnfG subunit [Myxococcota bacterium]|jgi:Na+-translocating ferredoxin:NAD+ oxidoreductase RnfG subunit